MLCVVDERKARLIIHRTVYASAVICAVSVCLSVSLYVLSVSVVLCPSQVGVQLIGRIELGF